MGTASSETTVDLVLTRRQRRQLLSALSRHQQVSVSRAATQAEAQSTPFGTVFHARFRSYDARRALEAVSDNSHLAELQLLLDDALRRFAYTH